MWNRILVTILIVLVFQACSFQFGDNEYYVKGIIQNYTNKPVILEEISLGDVFAVDTVNTDANGKFKFTGTVRDKGIYRLRLDNNAVLLLALNSNDEIQIEADALNPIAYKITGSNDCIALKKVIDTISFGNNLLGKRERTYLEMQEQKASDSLLNSYKAESNEIANAFFKSIREIALHDKSDIAALFAVSNLLPEKDLDTYRSVATRLQKESPNTKYTKDYIQKINSFVEDIVGKPFKEISLPNIKSTILNLSSLKGKWIYLNFWASSNATANSKYQSLGKINDQFKDKNFAIYNVSLDINNGNWANVVDKANLKLSYEVIDQQGLNGSNSKNYLIQQLPTNYLINPEGIIIMKNLSDEELISFLNKNLLSI